MREVDKLARAIRFGMGVFLAIVLIRVLFDLGKDATDPADGRSGMALHTDAETGCQYLFRGGLTPRLDQNGHHMCSK